VKSRARRARRGILDVHAELPEFLPEVCFDFLGILPGGFEVGEGLLDGGEVMESDQLQLGRFKRNVQTSDGR
jgi:hypothetical protein